MTSQEVPNQTNQPKRTEEPPKYGQGNPDQSKRGNEQVERERETQSEPRRDDQRRDDRKDQSKQ